MAVMHSSPACLVTILILDHLDAGFSLEIEAGSAAAASEVIWLFAFSLVSFGAMLAVLESLELSFSSGWTLDSALVETTDSSSLPFFRVSLVLQVSRLGLGT